MTTALAPPALKAYIGSVVASRELLALTQLGVVIAEAFAFDWTRTIAFAWQSE